MIRWMLSLGVLLLAVPASSQKLLLTQEGSTPVFHIPEGRLKVHQVSTGNEKFLSNASNFFGHPTMIRATRNGRLITDSTENKVSVWDIMSQKEASLRDFPIVRQSLTSLDVHGDVLVAGYSNGLIDFWSMQTGKLTGSVRLFEPIQVVAMSPDGKLLAAVSKTETSVMLTIWDPKSRKRQSMTSLGAKPLTQLGWDPRTHLLATSQDGYVSFWKGAKRVRHQRCHDAPLSALAFSDTADRFATSSKSSPDAIIWSSKTGERLTVYRHDGNLTALDLKGTRLVTGTEDAVHVWDLQLGYITRLHDHLTDPHYLLFTSKDHVAVCHTFADERQLDVVSLPLRFSAMSWMHSLELNP